MSREITKREEKRPEAVQQQERWLKPACDVVENEHEWLITADVPGVAQSALTLHVDKDQLVIEARRGDKAAGQDYAGFWRAFTLPVGLDAGKISAELRQGVVAVHLPKAEELKPRTIRVTAG
jgi:HSP20 family molecular chaperone IbpA